MQGILEIKEIKMIKRMQEAQGMQEMQEDVMTKMWGVTKEIQEMLRDMMIETKVRRKKKAVITEAVAETTSVVIDDKQAWFYKTWLIHSLTANEIIDFYNVNIVYLYSIK